MNGVDPRSLLAALAAKEAQRTGDTPERRTFERFTIRCEATIVTDGRWESGDSRADCTAYVRDASRGGLGVVTRQNLVVGKSYRLVCAADGVELFAAEVTPRHIAMVTEGVWCVGMAFLAEGARLVSLGVPAAMLRASEDGALRNCGGDFSEVAA